MKKIAFLLTVSFATALCSQAQTTTRFPASAPGLPASPVNAGLPASAANQGLPGFNNSFGPFFTNQFGNGFTSANLNQLLLNLQFDLTQVLPVLATINDSFDFSASGTNSLGTNGVFGSAGTGVMPVNPSSGTTSGNASTRLSTSSGANLGTSLGQDLSGIIGGRANAVSPGGTALGGASPAITPLAGTNPAFAGTATNGTGLAFMSERDVLRALIILQDDVEKMLPLVNALNGGNGITLNTVFTNNLGTVTNGFFGTRQLTTTPASRNNALTPTGR